MALGVESAPEISTGGSKGSRGDDGGPARAKRCTARLAPAFKVSRRPTRAYCEMSLVSERYCRILNTVSSPRWKYFKATLNMRA